MDLIREAEVFAREAHGQTGVTYNDAPYIVHPAEVVTILKAHGVTDPALLAAGWLHDVVEDVKGVTYTTIADRFGSEVAGLVKDVTKVSRKEDGPRAIRHAKDYAALARASPRGKALKCADVIANLRNIAKAKPSFARKYVPEKRQVLRALEGAAIPALLDSAWNELHRAEDYLAGN